MGSLIEINDTLQLTSQQGFPPELDYERHRMDPLTAEDFKNKIFEFKDKERIRIYHAPPVRNFLVENRKGKWLYWGLVNIVEVRHDYVAKTTSGKFKIVHLYSPDEMAKMHDLVDRNPQTRFQ